MNKIDPRTEKVFRIARKTLEALRTNHELGMRTQERLERISNGQKPFTNICNTKIETEIGSIRLL